MQNDKPTIPNTDWCGIASALIFKLVLILLYFICEPIWGTSAGKAYKLFFSITVSAVDFWTQKNISGRRLVGLLWKRKEDATAGKEWIFACRVNEEKTNSRNTAIFWGSMIGSVLFWLIFALYNFITLSFEVCCNIIPILLNTINFVAFLKCSECSSLVTNHQTRNNERSKKERTFSGA